MTTTNEVALAIRRALTMGAAATTGLTILLAIAQAQDQGQSADETEQTVVVTGSRIRRVDTETASPVFVLDSTAIQSSGVATAGELLQRIPAVAGAATNPQVNNGGGTGESNVELRGLSAQRTLVLLNGRRINILGQNGTTSAVDINMIPVNAIERVEVLKEGAGAIYGSDAIAGVVNFITRSDVDGAEASLQWGQTSESDGENRSAGIPFGTSTEKMSITVAANYNKQEGVSAGNRDFSAFALYLYGGAVTQGGSSRTPNGRIDITDTPLAAPVAGGGYGCNSITRIEGAAGSARGDYRCFQNSDAYNYQPLNLLDHAAGTRRSVHAVQLRLQRLREPVRRSAVQPHDLGLPAGFAAVRRHAGRHDHLGEQRLQPVRHPPSAVSTARSTACVRAWLRSAIAAATARRTTRW